MPIVMTWGAVDDDEPPRGPQFPVFVCDYCEERIDDARIAVALHDAAGLAGGPRQARTPVHFAHRRRCQLQLEARLTEEGASVSATELTRWVQALANCMEPGHSYPMQRSADGDESRAFAR